MGIAKTSHKSVDYTDGVKGQYTEKVCYDIQKYCHIRYNDRPTVVPSERQASGCWLIMRKYSASKGLMLLTTSAPIIWAKEPDTADCESEGQDGEQNHKFPDIIHEV